jgi:sulfur-oxidizing protein SoxB
MVRVGGLEYSCNPLAAMGKRIGDMRLKGKPIEPDRQYKVAGWAPVAEQARNAGNKPVWELVEQWLKSKGGIVTPRKINMPRLTGGVPNAGFAPAPA